MDSSYGVRETHHADMTLSVQDRINDLHRRAGALAPAVAESAMDSGCTDLTVREHGKLGPRQIKAWDMIAEAHGWNAISDDPEAVALAERYEREGIAYRVEFVSTDPAERPMQVVRLDWPEGLPKAGDKVTLQDFRAEVVAIYPASETRPFPMVRLQYEATGNRETVAADAVSPAPEVPADQWSRIQVLKSIRDDNGGWPTPQLEDEYYRLLGERYDPDGSHNLREPGPQAEGPESEPQDDLSALIEEDWYRSQPGPAACEHLGCVPGGPHFCEPTARPGPW